MQLHDYQQSAVNACLAHNKLCVSSPTGTGKSYMQLKLHLMYAPGESWIISPRSEIIAGYKRKLHEFSENKYMPYLCTPIKFRNMLLNGDVNDLDIKQIIFDEGHHSIAETYQLILEMIPDTAKLYTFTATPFRGTPQQTQEFLDFWDNNIYQAITYNDAWRKGYISKPDIKIIPMVDDDIIKIVAGEYSIEQVANEYNNKLVGLISDLEDMKLVSNRNGKQCIMPTIFNWHSTKIDLEPFAIRGYNHDFLTGKTVNRIRDIYFDRAIKCKSLLGHVNVVTEGVDLPFRLMIDCRPTTSPVLFAQLIGRIMRPLKKGEKNPLYICTNRNIEKYGYILNGLLPDGFMSEVQAAFPNPSRYNVARKIGLESLGRLKQTTLQLVNGIHIYSFAVHNENEKYVIVLHPESFKAVWIKYIEGAPKYKQWKITNEPKEFKGFKSSTPNVLSDKQIAWFLRDAKKINLEPMQEMDNKKFQVFAAMVQAGAKFKC